MSEKAYRILIAEDNITLSSVLRFNLQRAGYQVTVARDGREAWQRLQTDQFDLVVTDHQMPYMTGCELCQRMREQEETSQLPVFMLTAKGLELEEALLRDTLQISRLMSKPFSPAALVRAIEEQLGKSVPEQPTS